jgi:hypothetical protein
VFRQVDVRLRALHHHARGRHCGRRLAHRVDERLVVGLQHRDLPPYLASGSFALANINVFVEIAQQWSRSAARTRVCL